MKNVITWLILAAGTLFILAVWFVDWSLINAIRSGVSLVIVVAMIEGLQYLRKG